jgi:Glycosyl transferase 4-like domain
VKTQPGSTREAELRKVLILANDFPPLNTVGAQRPWSFFKYLKKYGYYPIVVTRHWNENQVTTELKHRPSDRQELEVETNDCGTIYRVPFKSDIRDWLIVRYGLNRMNALRKMLTFFLALGRYWLPWMDNLDAIRKQALEICKQEKIDFILATGEPFILFRQAELISRRKRIPWVADYRDGWSTNNNRVDSNSLLERLILRYEKWVEVRTVRSASFFTSVSRQIVAQIAALTGTQGVELQNGADLEAYRQERDAPDGVFRLVYTGILYSCEYLDFFCEGITRFIEQEKTTSFLIQFVGIESGDGNAAQKILAMAQKYPRYFQVIPRVPPAVAAKYQINATVLLSLLPGSQARGVMGAKTYGYAVSRNPIITILTTAEVETDFFPERDIQTLVFSAQEFFDVLVTYYRKHQKGDPLTTSITDKEIFGISREYQTSRLAGCLSTALDKSVCSAGKEAVSAEFIIPAA